MQSGGGLALLRKGSLKPHCRAVPADDNSVAVMFDFVNPVSTDRRLWSFNRLSGDDEPGRKRINFNRREKIGRRGAGNNKLGIVLSPGLQLLPPHTR
jgi:hypothetical protein